MLKKIKIGVIISIVLLCNTQIFSQTQTAFEAGNTAYNKGDFEAAITAYKSILEQGKHSAELYYNLANAYYKLNKTAPSIYYYEKALQLAPSDAEIQNNANFARNMTIDAIKVAPEVGLSAFTNRIITQFTPDGWSIIAIGAVIIGVILFVFYYVSITTIRKRLLFSGSIFVFILAGISLIMAYYALSLKANDMPAIIFAEETMVKSEPNLRSPELFALHEGTKVQILEKVDNWTEIKLADGKSGWIPSTDLKAL